MKIEKIKKPKEFEAYKIWIEDECQHDELKNMLSWCLGPTSYATDSVHKTAQLMMNLLGLLPSL